MTTGTRLKEVAIEGPAGVLGAPGGRVRSAPLCFSEMIVLIDELAEMAGAPESVRFEDFVLSAETIGMLEYARVRRLSPRIRLASKSLSTEAVEELFSETGAVVVIPIETSVTDGQGELMIRIAEHAAALGGAVEIETILRPEALGRLPALANFIAAAGFGSWKLDFLGDSPNRGALLKSRDIERAFASLVLMMGRMETVIDVREAPSFKRYLREKATRRGHEDAENIRVLTSRETLCISADGDVMPGRAIHVPVGNVRVSEVETINTRSGILSALRDPQQLRGRCGACEMNDVCGGSRARAWRLTRNLLAEDPGCFRARPWTMATNDRETRGTRPAPLARN